MRHNTYWTHCLQNTGNQKYLKKEKTLKQNKQKWSMQDWVTGLLVQQVPECMHIPDGKTGYFFQTFFSVPFIVHTFHILIHVKHGIQTTLMSKKARLHLHLLMQDN